MAYAPPREHDPARASFEPGDRVSFLDDKGKRLKGEVLSCTKKRVVIDADGYEWGIGPEHVSREPWR